ncbi:MAG: tetraacyldisaccharide 4'-kinase [Pseudomonadota bacterium]
MKTPHFWKTDSLLSRLLAPAALAYRFGAWCDRRTTMPEHASLKVLSIGNVTAGGAGKTPTALALAPMLYDIGAIPHVLTRGYKAQAHLTAHRVTDADDWRSVGDEALLLARVGPTWVGRDRIASARAATKAGATLLICDDALQHHRLHKDISLLVIDGPFGIGNGRMLPAGPLREPLVAALSRCHAVIIIGDDTQRLAAEISLPVFRAALQPVADTSFLHANRWVAFAGIGRPEKFFTTLRTLGAPLAATHAFPDHHAYDGADFAMLAASAQAHGARLITTEKDAVKLPPALRDTVSVLPVELVFEDRRAVEQFMHTHLA